MAEDVRVRSVVLTTGILEQLAAEKELGVSELAERLGMHKSTVYRFLSTLKDLGYVRQNEDSTRYRLSYRILELAGRILSGIDVRQAAHPVMERLAAATRETIHLATLEQNEIIYIDKIDSNQPLRMHSYIGQKIPAYATALGKVMLTWGPRQILDEMLAAGGLKRFTDNTIVDPAELRKEIETIRTQGYAEDREETVPGVRCLAAPIRDQEAVTVAAISISVPVLRFQEEQKGDWQKLVIEGALEISERLGCRRKSEASNPQGG